MKMFKPLVVLVLLAPTVAHVDAYRRVTLASQQSVSVPATDTAIAPPGGTAAGGIETYGGDAEWQVTCFVNASCTASGTYADGVAATCCTGSGTGTCGTWPDGVSLQARSTGDHVWVTVAGFTSSTADERQGVFWFAPGSNARVVVTDAAGSHTCSATLSFGVRVP